MLVTNKRVAVVILNWNGLNMLKTFLPSVISNTNSDMAEIVVADNGSTDLSIDWVKDQYPYLQCIELNTNHGYAKGYNLAIAQIPCEYTVLLNSDVEVSPNWLEPLIDYLDKHNGVGGVQPKIKAYQQKDKFEYAGACGGFIDRFGYPFCRGRILDTVEYDHGQYEEHISIMWATGACLVVRTALYRMVGGLDDRFFAHMEEIDFCWRIKNLGFQLMVIPESTVYHLGGGTLPNDSPHKLYLNYRNNLLLLYKNLSSDKFKQIMHMRWWLDVSSAFVYLAKGRFDLFTQVFKARRDYKRMKKHYKTYRKNCILQQNLKNHPEVYNGSIIWQYFVKKNKTFGQFISG